MKRSPLKPGKPLRRTRMKRRGREKPTADQQHYHDKIRALGCIICGRPAAIHHIREGLGMGQAVNHWKIIPLCYDHHQSEENGCISIHGTPLLFIETFGTATELERKLAKA